MLPRRLPRATREGNAIPEDREVLGDSRDIGVWAPDITTGDRKLAGMLRPAKVGRRDSPGRHASAATYSGDGVLFFALADALKRTIVWPATRSGLLPEAFKTCQVAPPSVLYSQVPLPAAPIIETPIVSPSTSVTFMIEPSVMAFVV